MSLTINTSGNTSGVVPYDLVDVEAGLEEDVNLDGDSQEESGPDEEVAPLD